MKTLVMLMFVMLSSGCAHLGPPADDCDSTDSWDRSKREHIQDRIGDINTRLVTIQNQQDRLRVTIDQEMEVHTMVGVSDATVLYLTGHRITELRREAVTLRLEAAELQTLCK